MFDLNQVIDIPPFSIPAKEKEKLYLEAMNDLTEHHYRKCPEYRKILDLLKYETTIRHGIDKIPFIPVRLFKDFELLSVDRTEISKTMTSSGTKGQGVSRIFLDRTNATNQTRVLSKIYTSFIGAKRMPLLIIDTKSVIRDRNLFSARGAGILGFSMFGYDTTYALDDNMQMDIQAVEAFLNKHRDENILLFGFTFMIWQYFFKQLEQSGIRLPLDCGIMIHGGGWKKLNENEVGNEFFKKSLEKICGIRRVYNYYGMVEQTGSIFMECEEGHLHCSVFSDILIRNNDFQTCARHEIGIVQLLSLLPTSYPGHSLLSEDEGEILGEDDCRCGRLGKYFKIYGRIKNAEIRGCSDTHEP